MGAGVCAGPRVQLVRRTVRNCTTAAPLLETRQAFGSSFNVNLGCSRGGRLEGALGYGRCRGVRQGSSGEADGGGSCHLFPESSNAPAIDFDPEIVCSFAELGTMRTAEVVWGSYCVLVHGDFRT